MGQKYRLKKGVGKHYLPAEKGKPLEFMEPGTIVDEEDVPPSARDKFEPAVAGRGGKPEKEIVNNLEAVEEEKGKWKVVHKKTGVSVHDGYLTRSEASDLLGEPIKEDKSVKKESKSVKKESKPIKRQRRKVAANV